MMNRLHRALCSSTRWRRAVEGALPPFLDEVDLGPDVLELGPGFGATTRVLVRRVPNLTALEVDADSARLLDAEFGDRAEIVHGDATAMPLPDESFSGVVSFTMLHHVPSPELQDDLFAETCRVLRPGGLFAGLDSQSSVLFRLLHLGDTMVVLDPETLPRRLAAAGFTDVEVRHPVPQKITFTARKPG